MSTTQEDDVKAPTMGDGFWINKISVANLWHICQSGSATCMLPALVNATDAIEDAKALIARLLARLEQAERDAVRYQLLRDSHPADKGLWVAMGLPYSPAGIACFREESLDAAIDAHIAAIAREAGK